MQISGQGVQNKCKGSEEESKVNWLSLHLEYNGGLNTDACSFNNCWLGGLTYSDHSDDWSKTWSVTASYKAIPGTIGLKRRSMIPPRTASGMVFRRALTLPRTENRIPNPAAIRITAGSLTKSSPVTSLIA